mmetsp:Transcript_29619/g.53748  ORF Transcript_29619/g.53748 Transcript_29619/m.53748 type:complete len:85 (-) Transcript_29619:823-1077(-)
MLHVPRLPTSLKRTINSLLISTLTIQIHSSPFFPRAPLTSTTGAAGHKKGGDNKNNGSTDSESRKKRRKSSMSPESNENDGPSL